MFGKKKKNKITTEPEIETSQERNEPREKLSKFDLIIRIVSTTLVLTCVGMLGYAGFLLFYDSANENASAESYITITNKNIEQSKKIYAEFGNNKQKKAADFALLGTKFFLSESKITPELLSVEHTQSIVGTGNSNLYLYNLNTDSSLAIGRTSIENNTFFIDLNKVDAGDYLVYSDAYNSANKKDYNPYSLASNVPILYSTYTLPDVSTHARKRITIKNNAASPFLLINIKNAGSVLPTDYYDAVLYYAQYAVDSSDQLQKKEVSEDRKALLESVKDNIDSSIYKVKMVNSIQDAFDTKANLSFAIGNVTEDYTSLYTLGASSDFSVKQIESGQLKGYDFHPEIRELTNYLGQAGAHYFDVVGNDTVISSLTHNGKESFLLEDNSEVSQKINNILKR